MQPILYARHQFPAEVIRHAVWLYLRFTLSYRDVEDLLAERGLEASYETVRRWTLRLGPATRGARTRGGGAASARAPRRGTLRSGPASARRLRQCRPKPSPRWHLDEMAVRIAGKQ